MSIAATLDSYLQDQGADYTLVNHPHSQYSMETAEMAHVPGDALVKAVLVKDQSGQLVVVLPSDYVIQIEALRKLLKREVDLVEETELGTVFFDCEPGAVPPLGMAYGLATIWDPESSLGRLDEIYFEGGDHRNLVCVSGQQFHELMAPAERGHFSHHM